MALRTKTVVIDNASSRDHQKSYLITEMPAEQAEWWAFRALQGILGSDAVVNFNAPLAELAAQGIKGLALIPWGMAKPLMEEMFSCVKIALPGGGTRDLLPGDTEEVKTRFDLRAEILELHLGFSLRGAA